jgi:hypothetical protein
MWASGIKHHQKINRVAHQKLQALTSTRHFPTATLINHFEGDKGPDSIKLKQPGVNETSHFYDPFDPDDSELLEMVDHHYSHLVINLQKKNIEKAAFEASWLAHALTDGLTPAHHYPYEDELDTLMKRGGGPVPVTIRKKITAKGDNRRETIRNNWGLWGAKGLLTTHLLFEGGVAAISAPLSFRETTIGRHETNIAKKIGLKEYFMRHARLVSIRDMYDSFNRRGWTTANARDVRDILMPTIIKVVAVAWYLALNEAGLSSRNGKGQA